MSESNCPVCTTSVSSDQGKHALCAVCETPYHPDCFAHTGKCGIYGCEGKSTVYEKKDITALVAAEPRPLSKSLKASLELVLAEYEWIHEGFGDPHVDSRNLAVERLCSDLPKISQQFYCTFLNEYHMTINEHKSLEDKLSAKYNGSYMPIVIGTIFGAVVGLTFPAQTTLDLGIAVFLCGGVGALFGGGFQYSVLNTEQTRKEREQLYHQEKKELGLQKEQKINALKEKYVQLLPSQ